jgi:hypothetical protein
VSERRTYSEAELEIVEEVIAVLEGQAIGLDSELDNWTIHAPFWAIRRYFYPLETDDDGPQ